MKDSLAWIESKTVAWLEKYGYFATVPALLLDPVGIPWAWIFLMMLARRAGKNVALLMVLGCLVLTVQDHALYWIGSQGGQPLAERAGQRSPRMQSVMEKSEEAVRGHGKWAVTFGRYIPVVGRWVPGGAGMADMAYLPFIFYDALGVILTVVGFGLLAHCLGRKLIDKPWFSQAVAAVFVAGTLVTLGLVLYGSLRGNA